MNLRAFAGLALFSLLPTLARAQAAPQPADIHASAPSRFPFFNGGALVGDRYILRGATMADLVAAAYSVDVTNVQGGPAWMERTRFDVTVKTPPNLSKADTKPMLQAVLADRFRLTVSAGSKPMPAYVLTVAKGTPKMKPAADDSAPPHCEYVGKPPAPGEIAFIIFDCKNTPMDSFAEQLHQWGGGYLTQPVVDSTGLKGGYDFELKWSGRGTLTSGGISLYDAVEQQLGLKLELLTAPRPVTIVAGVSETPTANPPGLDKILPPLPPREFEVAVIKPSKPGATGMSGNGVSNDRVDLNNVTLRDFMNFAWDLNPSDKEIPVHAPGWFDSDRFDILAKVSSTPLTKASLPDPDELRRMVRDLLSERFHMKTHMETLPMSGYVLTSISPKLKKADPTGRTGCKDGPGPDGKDPRIANPILGRLVFCQNITMAEFSEDLQRIAGGYVFGDVLNSTGLDGRYDFTLSFSGSGAFNRSADAPADSASEPNGAISLFDAIGKQLGLKLEKQKRPMSVLVIDHVDEKPTEN